MPYKESDRKRGSKVKVPPHSKVRIMERKAERVPYNSRPVRNKDEDSAGGKSIEATLLVKHDNKESGMCELHRSEDCCSFQLAVTSLP